MKNNYVVWHREIQYVLEKQKMMEIITQPMAEPEHGNNVQHKRDMEAYQAYKHKDCIAYILLLSNMRNDIMLHFKRHSSA